MGSKNLAKLLMTEPQADFLADTIEEGIEAAHEMTLQHEEGSEEYQYGANRIVALAALLDQFDPENPILDPIEDGELVPGREFDFDAFWEGLEGEEAPDSVAAGATRISPH